MSVGYLRREAPASEQQIGELEQRLGAPLPDDYRAYLAEQNGGRLASNDQAAKTIFSLGNDQPNYASMNYMLNTYAGRVPPWLLPIVQDEYGNLFGVSLRPEDKGSVWFWDHEEEADEGEPPTEDNIVRKADNWTGFLDSLRPPPVS
ncbi:SMI1/KNR4 family protein [Paractinoplanes toevensis]|uniref:Knr4/Smi1-like domain-containing protein n=1 Tax=Paractinoplanes toevensis TaxID=571911 RepID=A0A919TK91_9ACTN|nr:SMI1/KNR4 family protein [Actinoplanes toevensis]GIM95621.1 hypothetical protein Ato02nite_074140 [Actinoplanes toevensis]